jgi:putative nucleotidyltransferase with HDIG domain
MAATDLTRSRGATISFSSRGAADRTVDPLLGQTLGSFRILSLLGEGGMGRVYLAEHVLIGRRAAIKVLAAEIADKEELVSRFFTEARAVNDIRHPNIVEVTDFGSFGTQPYIVMELLDGETLEQRLERVRAIEPSAAAHVVAQVASAVAAGHEHGMVHRDLKPANIFLRHHPDYPDFVKVLDFGIAKLVARDHNVRHHTEMGVLIGTPAYMSPEQCLGDTHLDHRSDIYSLGVVLYQTVTGRLPFTGETAGRLIVCHVQEEPPHPQKLNPRVSPAMSAVILKAMAKRPDQRFASMRELRDAVLQAAPAAQPPNGPPTRPPAPSTHSGDATLLSTAPTTYRPSPSASLPSSKLAATPPPSITPGIESIGQSAVAAGLTSTSGSRNSTLTDRLVEILKSRTPLDIDLELPVLPRSVLRCLDLLGAPDFSFGGMASMLATDAKLATQLVQVANTTGPTHTPARSTEQAIARLGAEGVRTGLFEIALRPLLENTSPRLQAGCRQPWQHALAVAIIAQRLMHAHGSDERTLLDAYRAGLFHDAGKPVTANMLFAIERQMTGAKGRRIISEEMLVACLDRSHAGPGARLARAWGLSPEVAAGIEHAAAPPSAGFDLAGVIRLANALALKGGFHTRRDEIDRSRLLIDEARRAVDFDEETCHRVLEGIRDAVSRRL